MISKGVAKMWHYTGPVRVMAARDLSNSWGEMKNMNRISTLLIAVALPVAFAAPSAAQEGKTARSSTETPGAKVSPVLTSVVRP